MSSVVCWLSVKCVMNDIHIVLLFLFHREEMGLENWLKCVTVWEESWWPWSARKRMNLMNMSVFGKYFVFWFEN